MSRSSSTDLAARYRAAAVAHHQANSDGDPAVGNRHADDIAAIYRQLRDADARAVLLGLLTDEDVGVRGWAAAHALEFAPAQGEPVLAQIVTEDVEIAGFNAEVTLEEWRAGRLRFP